MQKVFNFFVMLILRLPENPVKNAIREIFYGNMISERILEYAAVFSNLAYPPSKKINILDIGSFYSNFPIQLASLGYRVWTVDMQEYTLSHPNFTFIRGDINKIDFGSLKFDIITCISTLEHIGVGVYGDTKNESGDRLAIEKIIKILKPHGQFLLTVPFGVESKNKSQRVYDWNSLTKVLAGFRVKKASFYAEKREKWLSVSLEVASRIKSPSRTRAVVFIDARKK